jgi:hypothetical protein
MTIGGRIPITQRKSVSNKKSKLGLPFSLGLEGDPARILEKVYSGYLLRIAIWVGKLLQALITRQGIFPIHTKNPPVVGSYRLDKLLEGFLRDRPP